MHIDLPSPSEIRSLLEVTGTPCVSIYLPTTPQSGDADAERIAFKNLAAEAVEQLKALDIDKRDLAVFSEELADVDDPIFWRYQANSLAVLATVDEVRVFRLANRLEPRVVVADRFFVKPLLRAVTFPHAGLVLALTQGSVRLLEFGSDYGPFEVQVDDLPADLDSFVKTVPGGDAAEGFGIRSPEGHNSRLRKYARQVDRAVRAARRGHDLPVVLAAAEPLASVFRAVSTMGALADEGISGNPEGTSDHELAAAARGVLDGIYAAEVRELAELFARRTSQGRTATDLADIARAATSGSVEVLVVDIDQVVLGSVGDEGALSLHDGPEAYGVVDEVARRVILASGRVVAVRANEVPGGREAAAILRYT